ncbi:histidine kinase [Gordonia sp. i37]|uniref:sensor histidine kinase n=1 Tax=Gordonia sp. i37 TaxID=1961707 RepID=UPI0009ADA9E3|nr:histidine kinase [Gordonia sp. i37]OPX14573.1 two-component sensor histidine kinase [Gordonia sp. i37]
MMGRMVRAARDAAVDELRTLPVVAHPGVRAWVRSPGNWFFVIFAVVLFAVSWPTMPLTLDVPAYAWPILAAVAAWPVAMARSAPMLGWAISVIGAQLIGLFIPAAPGWPWTIQVTHIIAFLILTFMAYLRCPLRLLAPVWICASLVMAFAAPPGARVGWVVGLTFMAVVVALLRGLLTSRRQLAVRTEETKVAESTSAVLQERARIARDLHDVVAHRMSMVVVMAQTARYRLPDVDEVCAAEFEAIAQAARTSLDEVRQLLGVLRVSGAGDGGEAAPAPSPGLADIDALISQTRRAGARIDFTDELDHPVFAESSALVIYRIVQECLANATRHAPGGDIEVRLTPVVGEPYAGPAAQVSVVNTAPTEPPLHLSGAGVGIAGMGDRARAVAGSLTATPTSDGGFAVRAHIPASARTPVMSSLAVSHGAVPELPANG